MPIAAAIIPAVIGAAGAIGSAAMAGSASRSAAKATQNATAMQVAEQQREYNQTRADHLPWLTTGQSALDQLAAIYGLKTSGTPGSTGATAPDYSSFYKSPDYNFAMTEGLKGVDAGASSGGYLDSGATRKAEIKYASNLASSNFNTYANRLAGIAGVGQTAADNIGAAGQNAANQIGSAYQNQGNNLASSYLAQGQTYGNAIGQLAGIASSVVSNNPQWFNSTSASSTPTNFVTNAW